MDMNYCGQTISRLSEQDLDFLINTVSPMVTDKVNLRKVIREDDDYRNEYIGDEKVFRKLMDDDAILLKISPSLFFEILLRKALKELSNIS